MQPPMMQHSEERATQSMAVALGDAMQTPQMEYANCVVDSKCASMRSLDLRIASLRGRLSLRMVLVVGEGDLSSW